jgi:hypothetical protein
LPPIDSDATLNVEAAVGVDAVVVDALLEVTLVLIADPPSVAERRT